MAVVSNSLHFKNNHGLFMACFFFFLLAYLGIFFLITGTFLSFANGDYWYELPLGIPACLFLSGLVKYLFEKYVEKRKVSFLEQD